MIASRTGWLATVVYTAGIAALSVPSAAQELPFLEYARIDPGKVMTADACGECHAAELEVWEGTPHASGFKTLHRKTRAEEIAGKLGFRLIKRQSFCYTCHYTPVIDDDEIKVVSGVSCESCHGAGLDWIDIHNDYGGTTDYHAESDAHRQSRIERSRAAGMRRPSDLYPVVANCFSCHTVPNEQLVNVGGHSTGSSTFEFVDWSQNRIRHNFLESFKEGTNPVNATRPLERKRPMYVVGRALDLEYSLRGMAEATETGIYSRSMARRVRSALAEVQAIAATAELPDVDEMIRIVRGVKAVPGNRAALLEAAEKIGAASQRFLSRRGLQLAALDPLVLGTAPPLTTAPDDSVAIAEVGEDPAPGADSGRAPAAPGGGPSSPATPAGTALPTASAPSAPQVPQVEGTFKTRARAASKHRTLGPGSCGGCHADQNEWWFDHAHFAAADPFFDGERKNLQIARLYGLSAAQMTRGDQICMDCHGTIVSGKESRDVLDGVGCESCHGAAADWLEPHKVEGGSGANRPGYLDALERGKTDLKRLSVRGEVCTGCHYITEPRLLSAGHPSGASFDYIAGMASVRHWSSGPAARSELASAFDGALQARGPLPRVRVASLPAASAPSAPGASATAAPRQSRAIASTTPARTIPEHAATRVLRARPSAAGPSGSADDSGGLRLPPFPEIDADTPFEDVLLLLKERLARLFERLEPAAGGAGGQP